MVSGAFGIAHLSRGVRTGHVPTQPRARRVGVGRVVVGGGERLSARGRAMRGTFSSTCMPLMMPDDVRADIAGRREKICVGREKTFQWARGDERGQKAGARRAPRSQNTFRAPPKHKETLARVSCARAEEKSPNPLSWRLEPRTRASSGMRFLFHENPASSSTSSKSMSKPRSSSTAPASPACNDLSQTPTRQSSFPFCHAALSVSPENACALLNSRDVTLFFSCSSVARDAG